MRPAIDLLAATLCATLGLSWAPAAAQPGTLPTDDLRLVDAVQRQDIEAVGALLAARVPVDTPQADGATPLAWAVHWDDRQMADLLIQAGADVNASNDLGVTPLMLACTNGSGTIVKALLRSGADT